MTGSALTRWTLRNKTLDLRLGRSGGGFREGVAAAPVRDFGRADYGKRSRFIETLDVFLERVSGQARNEV